MRSSSAPTREPAPGRAPDFDIGEVTVTAVHVIAAIVALVVFPALQLFLSRTRWGRAIRALADNPKLAVVRGIDASGSIS